MVSAEDRQTFSNLTPEQQRRLADKFLSAETKQTMAGAMIDQIPPEQQQELLAQIVQNPAAQQALKNAAAQAYEYAKVHGVPFAKALAVRGWEEAQHIDWDEQMEHLFTTKEADKHFWELLTDVPKVKKPIALLLAVLNCVIPGAGSVVISFIGDERQLAWSWDKTTFITGVIQLLLIYWYIGYAFGAFWGYLFVKQALKKENNMLSFISRYSIAAVGQRQKSLARQQTKAPQSSPF